MADELHALARILPDAEWPPWADCRINAVMGQIRRRIDEQLDREGGDVDEIAARLGLDFDELRKMAAEQEHVGRWVSVLRGPSDNGGKTSVVIAELLMVFLFADELAYIGMLARAIGPAEREVAMP